MVALTNDEIELLSEKELWGRFVFKIIRFFGLIFHRKIYEEYILRVLNDLVDDGFQHVDIRMIPESVKDDVTKDAVIPEHEIIEIYLRCIEKIRERVPSFSFSMIYMAIKTFPRETFAPKLEIAFQMAAKYPEIRFGYDLVDTEDGGKNQIDLLDILIGKYDEFKKKYKSHVDYVFHVGESHNVDNYNLVDCLMLDTKRIGHGFLLGKHCFLQEEVKKRGLVIEV